MYLGGSKLALGGGKLTRGGSKLTLGGHKWPPRAAIVSHPAERGKPFWPGCRTCGRQRHDCGPRCPSEPPSSFFHPAVLLRVEHDGRQLERARLPIALVRAAGVVAALSLHEQQPACQAGAALGPGLGLGLGSGLGLGLGLAARLPGRSSG